MKIQTLLITLLWIFVSVSAVETSASLTEQIVIGKKLYTKGINEFDEASLKQGIDHFNHLLHIEDKKWLVQFYVGYGYFRLGSFYNHIAKDESLSIGYYDESIRYLQKSIKANPNFSDTYAILSANYGSKILMSPWKAMYLMRRSEKELKNVFAIEPSNPRVWLQRGIAEYHTPKILGGGKRQALMSLNKALAFYRNEESRKPRYLEWGEDEAHIWRGNVFKALGEYTKARVAYERALRINPKNKWLKDILIPQLGAVQSS